MSPAPPTPRQHADALYATLSPHEQLAIMRKQRAYIETLDVDKAPLFILHAEPDNADDVPLELTITGPEFLADFKALALARLAHMGQLVQARLTANQVPMGCTTTELTVAPGVNVTIVRPASPPIAHNEAEVALD